jgi:uncharacterized membrane protein YfcA
MDILLQTISPSFLVLAFVVAFVAGAVKGIVGFAMPTVMISGLSTFLAPELALAALIIPTLLSNLWQALRQGIAAAVQTVKLFKIYVICCLGILVLSAQMVRVLPQAALFLVIGVPVAGFALLQLVGWRGRLEGQSPLWEAAVGSFAGFMGGLSGVWGPPTVAYLTAIGTQKQDQIRAQGTIFGLGSLALLGAHLQSGVLRAETLPFSIAMVVPALVGMGVGLWVQDRIDQAAFRKATLAVLLVAGINLVRRGVMG